MTKGDAIQQVLLWCLGGAIVGSFSTICVTAGHQLLYRRIGYDLGMSEPALYLALYAVWLAVPVTAFIVTRRLRFYLRVLIASALGIGWLCILCASLVTRIPPHSFLGGLRVFAQSGVFRQSRSRLNIHTAARFSEQNGLFMQSPLESAFLYILLKSYRSPSSRKVA
jgi:hypothetical protein